ncbi:hypothetical protein D3C81_884950 [compost metagenome]
MGPVYPPQEQQERAHDRAKLHPGQSTQAVAQPMHRRRLRQHRCPFPRPRCLDRSPPGPALHLAATGRCRRSARPRADGAGRAAGRPPGYLGAQLRRVVHHPVRQRQGRSDPGQYQPSLPFQRTGLRPGPVRLPLGDLCRCVQDLRLPCAADRAGARPGFRRAGCIVVRALPRVARRGEPCRRTATGLSCLARAAGPRRVGQQRRPGRAPGATAV